MPDNLKIDILTLKKDKAAIFTLNKVFFSSLSRPHDDRPCVDDVSYDWGSCLDNMFLSRKGCQDPWDLNTGTHLFICDNFKLF